MKAAIGDRSARPTLDWEQAHLQLERGRSLLEAGRQRSPEQAQRILEARARELARPRAARAEAVDTVDLLVCSVGHERYGLDLAQVLDVGVAAGLTPVPCTPPFVLGVVSHRGRILPVVDVRLLLEPAAEPARGGFVAAVEAGGMQFGIAVDEVSRVVRVPATEIARPPGVRDHVVRGVTGNLVSVLDLEALARHPRLEVRDEVG